MRIPVRLAGRLALALTTTAVAVGGGSIASASPPATPVAIAAKSCSGSYTHAVIGGAQKCLRRGEFCAHRYASQYRRYGFSCTHTDDRGNYHLT
ncbi:MAG TPA: hypothetical protein VH061_00125 [Solirubrobacteraceae bacterium]|jgi:hypothetical protein|nr:hypothetical protein [Solirubrobacteraceae bacterium]